MTDAAEERNEAAGLRVLMVEDEMMLAMSLEDLLGMIDCEVVKASRLNQALALAKTEPIDGALLDVNLAGDRVYAVADELDRRGIPFAFMTGYSASDLRPEWQDRPVLQKPFLLEDLQKVMSTFGAQGSA